MRKLLISFLFVFLLLPVEAQVRFGVIASSSGTGVSVVLVTDITVSGTGGATTIVTNGGTLQMLATVLPSNATDKSVTWSKVNGSGQASISVDGLLTAVADGTVTVTATANDGSAVYDDQVITISNQIVQAGTELILDPYLHDQNGYWYTFGSWVWNGTDAAITNGGTGDNYFEYFNDALYTVGHFYRLTYTFTGVSGSGVRAGLNGTDIDTWRTADGTYVTDLECTTVDRPYVDVYPGGNTSAHVTYFSIKEVIVDLIPVTSISLSATGHATTIVTNGGTLQLYKKTLPLNATDTTATWTVISGSGSASVNSSGLVTAISNGTVTIRATATDGSGIYGSYGLTLSNQGGSYGSDLLLGQGAFANAGDWVLSDGMTITGGQLVCTNAAAYGYFMNPNAACTTGKSYHVIFTISGYSGSGTIVFQCEGGGTGTGTSRSADGTYTEDIGPAEATGYFYFNQNNQALTCHFDNITIQEIP